MCVCVGVCVCVCVWPGGGNYLSKVNKSSFVCAMQDPNT